MQYESMKMFSHQTCNDFHVRGMQCIPQVNARCMQVLATACMPDQTCQCVNIPCMEVVVNFLNSQFSWVKSRAYSVNVNARSKVNATSKVKGQYVKVEASFVNICKPMSQFHNQHNPAMPVSSNNHDEGQDLSRQVDDVGQRLKVIVKQRTYRLEFLIAI